MAAELSYLDKIKVAFFSQNKKKGSDQDRVQSENTSTPKQSKQKKSGQKKALKDALALSRLLQMDQIILNPKKDGNIFDQIKTHVKFGLAADNIPIEELSIPDNIVFNDDMIRQRKSRAGQPIELIDERILLSLYDNLSDEQVDAMLEEFWFQMRGKRKLFENAIKYSDYNQINELAHDMKGTSGNFGLMKLSAFALAVERSSNRKDNEKIQLLISKLDGLVKSSRDELIHWQSQRVLTKNRDKEINEQDTTA